MPGLHSRKQPIFILNTAQLQELGRFYRITETPDYSKGGGCSQPYLFRTLRPISANFVVKTHVRRFILFMFAIALIPILFNSK